MVTDNTVASYFHKMVLIFSSLLIYTTFVKPPSVNPLSLKVQLNHKLYPYFKDTIGAINGSHIPIAPPVYDASAYRNHKGFLLQNGIFVCDFDLHFTYVLTGWEGSALDSHILGNACSCNLEIPEGRYFLGDLEFPFKASLLVPYRGVCYHLAEWGQVNIW